MTGKSLAYKNLAIIVLGEDDARELLPLQDSDFLLVNKHIGTCLEYKQFRFILTSFGLIDGQSAPSMEQIKRALASKSKKGIKLNETVQLLIRRSRWFFLKHLTRAGLEARLKEAEEKLAKACNKSASFDGKLRQANKLLEFNQEVLRCSRSIEEAREHYVSNLLLADIDVLEMGVRPSRCLRENGVNKVVDLTRKTREEIMAYPQFGRKSMNEVVDVLRMAGLDLAEEPWSVVSQKPDHKDYLTP